MRKNLNLQTSKLQMGGGKRGKKGKKNLAVSLPSFHLHWCNSSNSLYLYYLSAAIIS